jgi:hypothetical protein
MKICANCQRSFSSCCKIDGVKKNLGARKFCLECSPWGQHNTRTIGKRKNCVICSKKLEGNQTIYCSRSCTMKKAGRWYKQQKDRAIQRKKDLVNKLGGKCSKCDYNKNLAALDFHHLDPSKKETPMNLSFLLKMNWEKCLKEVSKCILLCANCHREHHNPQYENW